MISNTVICFKWGTKFPPHYVNNLYNSIKRNTTIPFRFVCVTDDSEGFIPEIDSRPLIDTTLNGWWQKVTAFTNPLHDITGNVLLIDLDMIILDNIDCFFEREGSFIMEQDYLPRNGFSTCVMRFEANQHEDIYTDVPRQGVRETSIGYTHGKYWGDQVWVTEKRPDATVWPLEWVKSYKWECFETKNDFKSTFTIPEGCKIIKFHGSPSIEESLIYNHINEFWK